MSLQKKHQCVSCKGENQYILTRKDTYSYYKCSHCSLVSAIPLPSDEEINEYYDGFLFKKPTEDEINDRKNEIRNDVTLIVNDIKRFNNSTDVSFLDFGGGTGYYSEAFHAHGYEVTLLDLDPQSCDYVREKFPQLNVICDNPMKNKLNKKFDIVFCNQVIEHYTNPHKLLSTLRELLNDDGILITTTPNQQCKEYWFRYIWVWDYVKLTSDQFLTRTKNIFKLFSNSWLCCDPPRHIYSFNKKNLANLHHENNLEVISMFTEYVTSQYYSLKQHNDFSIKRFRSIIKLIYNLYIIIGIRVLRLLDFKNNWGNNLVIFSKRYKGY